MKADLSVSRLFIDASVFIAAAGSPEGGSSFVLELCKRGRFHAVCTKLVLLEAERNIHRKLGAEALLRFYQDLATSAAEPYWKFSPSWRKTIPAELTSP